MDINPLVYLNDGNQMPLIGVGTLNFKPNDKHFNLNDFIMNAVKTGYTHFDINPNSNESSIGEALKLVLDVKRQLEDEEGNKIPDEFEPAYARSNLFISYKVYNTNEIEKNIKNALEQMKLEYFDLIMLNCPTSPPEAAPQQEGNEGEPKEEVEDSEKIPKRQSMRTAWAILEECKSKGLCKSIGVSNFTTLALLMLCPFVKVLPTVNQIETHPFLIQKNLISTCRKLKIVPMAYCPLLRGGKDQKQILGDKIDYMSESILKEIAPKYAKTIPQIILNYQICRGVAVTPKTEKLDHLTENFNITDFQLLEEDTQALESLDREGKVKVYQLKNLPLWRGEDPLC